MKSILKIALGIVLANIIIFVGFIGCVGSAVNDIEEKTKKEKSCLVIQDSELVDASGEYYVIKKYIKGTIKNICDKPIDYVEVKAITFDINGNQINNGGLQMDYVSDLKEQGTWQFKIVVDEDADKYELKATNDALE